MIENIVYRSAKAGRTVITTGITPFESYGSVGKEKRDWEVKGEGIRLSIPAGEFRWPTLEGYCQNMVNISNITI